MKPRSATLRSTALVTALALLLAGCSGAGGGGRDTATDSITVIMVGNPQMEDLRSLTEKNFTARTGIEVNITILPENELRDRVTQDVATKGGQFDVVTIGAYEAPIWAKNGWLTELGAGAKADAAYAYDDLLPPMVESLSGQDEGLYALPFYGESSFLMYRKDIFAAKGLTMPERPTWQQVADLAAKVDGAKPGMSGICLRGLPGWGELFAPLTSVVNTFGGTWFTKDWEAQVNSPSFVQATQFYVDLVRKHGQDGASQAGFTECLNAVSQEKAAMWYDATSAAGSLEDPKTSKVAGKMGYVRAPVVKTKSSGWLWAWSLAVPETSKKKDAAGEFARWASSQEYEKLVGSSLGWSRVPAGKRMSTYQLPEYTKAAAAFADVTLQSIQEADPENPGVQPRPTVGIQFVAIPEFANLATKISQEVSAAIAGKAEVKAALDQGQLLAAEIAAKQK